MAGKMKAVIKVKDEPNGTEMMLIDIPTPGPNEVLIKIKTASICGTDVHIFNWDNWASKRIKTPLIYGHEFAGEVVEIGKNVEDISEGDSVSAECHIACGYCAQCRLGLAHVCHNLKVIGIDAPGIFAEYACIPVKNVWKNDPSISPELCSVQDPLGNAIHSVFSADIAGKDVAILGLGPIGIMCTMLCKHVGASQIFAVEKNNEYRADLAKKVGATRVFCEGEGEQLKKEILEATSGNGVDVVLEMSGAAQALVSGLDLLKAGGEMIVLGVYTQPVALDISKDVVFKYTTIKGIYGRRMFSDWYRMKGLLKNPGVRKDLQTIITHRFPFDDFFVAMEMMRSGRSGKVVLSF